MTANQPPAPTERTRVRRRPQRGHYDRTTIDAILDAGFVCHVGNVLNGADLSCLLLDIDYFKVINDTFGHVFGDSVLREFSACLKLVARKYDFIFRYGGEEFMIHLPNTGIDGARSVAEKIPLYLRIKSV